MDQPNYIPASFINNHNNYPELIELLKNAFATNAITIPNRLHYDFGAKANTANSTLLLMPAWQDGADIGIKLVTINPANRDLNLPSIQGSYLLMDATNGITKAMIDAKALTIKRTAATSALASTFLSRPDSSSLLMVGTGALAPELIAAHAAIRPITEVFVWGRNYASAQQIANDLDAADFSVRAIEKIEDKIKEVDIISTATLSPTPLILGKYLEAGQHLDLVGSYKPDMREADDLAVLSSSLFVDTYDGAMKESGDLFLPIQQGIIDRSDIQAELNELCSGKHGGRQSDNEITFFKSVGYALEDLIAARYFYRIFAA